MTFPFGNGTVVPNQQTAETTISNTETQIPNPFRINETKQEKNPQPNLRVKKAVTVAEILEAIEKGYTKSERSPYFDESIGTLLTLFNCTQDSLKKIFEARPELEKAYCKRFPSQSLVKFDLEIID